MRQRGIGIALVAVAIGALAILAYLSRHDPGAESSIAAGSPAEEQPDLALAPAPRPALVARPAERERSEPPENEVSDADVVLLLQQKFGKTIHHKHTQIKALEKLIAQLMKMYPDDWQERVYDFLRQAFPDRADELYAQFHKLMRYNDWMRDNRHELVQMDARDRREALWDSRYQFFGEDAEEIWEVTRKNERILDSLEAVGEAGGGVAEKLETYLDAIDEAYGEQAEPFLQKRGTELMIRFLSVDTVQDDLHAMPSEERQQTLREVRRGMGLDEEAVARLEALDMERDREWAAGAEYMQAREQIIAQDQGEAQEQRLAELRSRLFGEQAEIIRDEEQAGFFRFQHRRVYGRE